MHDCIAVSSINILVSIERIRYHFPVFSEIKQNIRNRHYKNYRVGLSEFHSCSPHRVQNIRNFWRLNSDESNSQKRRAECGFSLTPRTGWSKITFFVELTKSERYRYPATLLIALFMLNVGKFLLLVLQFVYFQAILFSIIF